MSAALIVQPPAGIFRGHNFMTPDVLAFYRLVVAGRSLYVELSSGRGMDNETIYGVTVRDANGARLEPDPSACCHSKAQAMELIANLAEGRR